MKIDKNNLKNIIKNFKKTKILIIGDLMLDKFVWGKVSRISPEAPVPVVRINKESHMPGGAANVAANITALGGKAYLCGVIGKDYDGTLLIESLKKQGIIVEGNIKDKRKPTIVKTRVVAHHQQVVRIDKEEDIILSKQELNKVLSYIKKVINTIDAIIIEDYGKGMITSTLISEIVKIANKYEKIVSVDPKEDHLLYYKNTTVLTPNHHEAGNLVGIKIKDKDSLNKAGRMILNKLKVKGVLITLGEDGMCLFEKGKKAVLIPTVAREVFDVSGAGDTVIAAFTLSLASGAKMTDAAYISNFAGGVVVGKMGVATISPADLTKAVQ